MEFFEALEELETDCEMGRESKNHHIHLTSSGRLRFSGEFEISDFTADDWSIDSY